MEIVEKQPFGYPCLCGDIIRECPLIFMRGKYIQGRIDYCLLFFFGQMNVRRNVCGEKYADKRTIRAMTFNKILL